VADLYRQISVDEKGGKGDVNGDKGE
jgi:hypothetical protein